MSRAVMRLSSPKAMHVAHEQRLVMSQKCSKTKNCSTTKSCKFTEHCALLTSTLLQTFNLKGTEPQTNWTGVHQINSRRFLRRKQNHRTCTPSQNLYYTYFNCCLHCLNYIRSYSGNTKGNKRSHWFPQRLDIACIAHDKSVASRPSWSTWCGQTCKRTQKDNHF